jgi:hypothetical protein
MRRAARGRCPGGRAGPAGHAGLSDAEIDRRIDFLEQKLDDSRTHGQIWYWSWLAINGGSTVGN